MADSKWHLGSTLTQETLMFTLESWESQTLTPVCSLPDLVHQLEDRTITIYPKCDFLQDSNI